MPDLKLEDVKKKLNGLVEAEKLKVSKVKEAGLPEAEKLKAVDEAKKAEETKAAAEEAQKREDEILNASEEEIKDTGKFSDEERARRVELLDKKKKEDEAKETPLDKIEKIKNSTQQRIDEINNELKQFKEKSSKEIETLRKEKQALEDKISKPKEIEDEIVLLQKAEDERIQKQIEEDKDKPREQKREMSEEELEEWELEEPVKARRWIAKNELQRARERLNFQNKRNQEKIVKEIIAKQDESAKKVAIKHPELDVSKRQAELKAQGKGENEIREIIFSENPKVKLASEILIQHPEWQVEPNAAELIAAEMEKRLASSAPNPSKTKEQEIIEELSRKVEEMSAEIAQLSSVDEGLGGGLPRGHGEILSENEGLLVKTMKKAKASQAMIDSALAGLRKKK